jgi:hypothetical protein
MSVWDLAVTDTRITLDPFIAFATPESATAAQAGRPHPAPKAFGASVVLAKPHPAAAGLKHELETRPNLVLPKVKPIIAPCRGRLRGHP